MEEKGTGCMFTFPFPCTHTTSAAKGVVFMDIIRKPFLLAGFHILLKHFSLRSFNFEPQKTTLPTPPQFLRTDSTLIS